jgi:Tol biopolymer transport system component
VVNADGSGLRNLSNNPAIDRYAAWSPDGTKIAFYDGVIYVMNADGSGLLKLTNNPTFTVLPQWSPDGTKILFVSLRDGNEDIYAINADGSGLRHLTNHPGIYGIAPAWRPR